MKRRVLVTGAEGFIGRNLCSTLQQYDDVEILKFDLDQSDGELTHLVSQADFVFHLAGVNRTTDATEFNAGNRMLTENLVDALTLHNKTIPVLFSSSIQATQDNPYGASKRAAEDVMLRWASLTGGKALVYRLKNVFGKWCRPNYNSVVATFCHNIAHGLPIQVNDPNREIELCYIDDVVEEFIRALDGAPSTVGESYTVPVTHLTTLGELASTIQYFKQSRQMLTVADMSNPLVKKLYGTYLSYLPQDDFSYPLTMHCDPRGSFTEFLRTPERGQVSVNVIKPGITKGNHWHHSKNEKFLVVSGEGIIRLRRVGSSEVIEVRVCGDNMVVVDIPTGYTHNIQNIGKNDMLTVMWANEPFNPQKPDTYYLEV